MTHACREAIQRRRRQSMRLSFRNKFRLWRLDEVDNYFFKAIRGIPFLYLFFILHKCFEVVL